jgi:hypothetical protein
MHALSLCLDVIVPGSQDSLQKILSNWLQCLEKWAIKASLTHPYFISEIIIPEEF